MNYIALALALLQSVLASAKIGNAEQAIITGIEEALAKLASVQGSDVTYQQLEELRSKVTW
jgi:hypothetical protein